MIFERNPLLSLTIYQEMFDLNIPLYVLGSWDVHLHSARLKDTCSFYEADHNTIEFQQC